MKGGRDRDSKSSTPLVILAILFIVLMVSGLVFRFWAVEREHDISGPTHISAGMAGVFVHVAGDILQLSPSGGLVAVHDRAQTGLDDRPIDLRLLDNGELLVATQQPATIRVCAPDAWSCREIGQGSVAAIERQFKLLPTDHDGWLLTDAGADTLWRMREDSSGLTEVLPRKTLAGPNGLARAANGYVWIADTDHRRIVELLPLEDGTFVTGREHSAMNAMTVDDRHYPMMLELATDGRLWVIQATDFSQALADLMIYDPDDGVVASVPLGEGAYPTDLTVLGSDLLVTDMEHFGIYRVNMTTQEVSRFGESSALAQFQYYRAERESFALLSAVSLASVVFFAALAVLAVLKATPRERRWSQVPALEPGTAADTVPQTKGVHWLERNSKMRWFSRWLDRVYYILFGLLCLVCLIIYSWACRQPWWPEGAGLAPSDQLGIALLLTCLAVAAFLPMMHRSAQVLKRRVGTDGKRVHFELEDGRRIACDPSALRFNRRALMYRQYTFPMHSGRAYSLYAEGEVDTWLAPMLREATRLGEWQTLRHQWRYRDPLILAVAAAIAFMVLVLLLVEYLFDR